MLEPSAELVTSPARSTSARARVGRPPADHGDERDFVHALERARQGDIDLESALTLLQGDRRPEGARQLFAAARRVRDTNLGRRLALTAHLHMESRCEISPPCNYCSLSSSISAVQGERDRLSARGVALAARDAVDRGVDSIVLVGGTSLDGSDRQVRRTVEAVRDVTDAPLALDVGPSISTDTVEWLKGQDARTIYCSIETINAEAFHRAKPGDSLDARVAFNDLLQRHGMTLGNVVMNGLGSVGDLVNSVLFLRRYRSLRYLYVSTFHPVPGTPWATRRPASVRTSLATLAIARLVFPQVHVGLAEVEVEDPGSGARIAPQLRAGGGNTFAAILVYRHRRVDRMDEIVREAAGAGFVAG